MKSPRSELASRLATTRQHRLWSDKLSVTVITVAALVNAIALAIVLWRLKPLSYAIPVRYTSVAGFDTLGPWYVLYAIPLYGFIVLAANTGLAMKAFAKSRIASFFLLLGAVVVALLCLVIGTAFVMVV